MTDPKANLITKYLAGDATADELQQLQQTLASDPQAADELMSEAFMDVHLREMLGGSAPGTMIAEESRTSSRIARRSTLARWMVAAMLLLAMSGWAVAAYVAGKLGQAHTNIAALKSRVTELEASSTSQPVTVAKAANAEAPEIHSLRGWLRALPKNSDTEGQTLLVGTTAPLDQKLWTCPWGAAEFRYDSGVSISVERNTTVRFNETDELRQLDLERGIVHVTNLSEIDNRPTEIKSKLATVRLIRGQVAVQVDKQRTAVEAAMNEVEVFVEEEGVPRTFTVQRGQYLIIKPGEKTKIVQGMLKLGLEPSNT